MAQIIRTLRTLEPRVLAVDILFVDRTDPEEDGELAAALNDAQAVVAAAAVFTGERGGPQRRGTAWGDVPEAERLLLPIAPVTAVAGIGLVNIASDPGGTPRHVPLAVRAEGALIPSFPLRVASIAVGSDPVFDDDRMMLGSIETVLDLGRSLPLRFYGPRGTIRTISARRVLRGEVGPQEVRGRIVVVGSTAIGAGDRFSTPFDPVFPGVEVLATAIAHLTSGDGLVRSHQTRLLDAGAAVALPAAAVLLLTLRSIGIGLGLSALVFAGWAGTAVLAFQQGIWLSMAVPLAGAVPPALLCIGARFWFDRQLERRLFAAQDNLRRFHPPALADHLAEHPEFLNAPTEQSAAVLFIDLTGFTGLSERLGPTRTRTMLKAFHTLVEDVVTDQGGLVLSFMGDGAMIVFGIPEDQEDDAARALSAAVALATAVRRWIDALPADSRATDVRVGAHFGPVVVSRLGPDSHQHITATGDSVNVASRLLEVAAQHKATGAFSSELLKKAARPLPAGLGDETAVSIRGRNQPLTVCLWHVPDT
jgi:adenylate cyclase